MNYSTIDQYWIWLASVEGIGPKRFYQLMSLYEDARSVWDALGGVLSVGYTQSAILFLPLSLTM